MRIAVLVCAGLERVAGADAGRAGGPGGQDHPFWGTDILYKGGNNVVWVHANAPCFGN